MKTLFGRARVSSLITCGALLVAVLAYGCGGSDSPTTPSNNGPIRVIAGGGQTDTAAAMLSQPLVVEIHDSTSRIAPGASVRFKSFVPATGRSPYVLVSPIGQEGYGSVANDVTDAQGRARTLVRLGFAAGTALLEVSVPALGLVDTVSYTIKPGAPAGFNVAPRDTTILPGTSYTLRAPVTDRNSNPITGATPQFSAMGVTVSSSGQITAPNATARGRIVVTYGTLSDSTRVWIVPRLPMVINRFGTLGLINSDGTGATTLAPSPDGYYSIAPSSVAATPSVVYYRGDPLINAKLWVVQPNGVPRPLLSASTRFDSWPRLSPDGAWVYFVRDMKSLWRVKLDGTGLDSLTSFTASRVYGAPTVSPDGRSVAVEDGTGVQIVDVATKATRTLPVTCPAPHYSPDGTRLACLRSTDLSTVKTDGTGRQIVTSFDAFGGADPQSGVDWTPDGQWLLVMLGSSNGTLIEVSTGTRLPVSGLAASGSYLQPSFVR